MMTRAAWKYWYREMRICRREASKAAIDSVIYGSGFVRVSAEGVRHIPFDEIREAPPFKEPSPALFETLELMNKSLRSFYTPPNA